MNIQKRIEELSALSDEALNRAWHEAQGLCWHDRGKLDRSGTGWICAKCGNYFRDNFDEYVADPRLWVPVAENNMLIISYSFKAVAADHNLNQFLFIARQSIGRAVIIAAIILKELKEREG